MLDSSSLLAWDEVNSTWACQALEVTNFHDLEYRYGTPSELLITLLFSVSPVDIVDLKAHSSKTLKG